ncbi:MAG: tRNA (adenosine(37)-N6)-threonylcarbamoyltransferase complex dimerization subunit type 1 TsaB [Tepidanaerobacteraceae bacterium]|jgi:tRNA threonylcarbamoyladenosine biosynthesis protein TsaB|nr:tRNA (adenosine(37)-N6)-threonylcarbamoyltransferase complex dimerization subunit type 1 TsaB [Thermoanaerobacterales bacterium]
MTHVLGIDTSSIVATIAIINEEKLLAEYIVNNKKTHSEKMMGVIDNVLADSGVELKDIDVVAVAKGPGSFTGIRIGMACAQGLAHALKKPMIGVNTLDGLAYNLIGTGDLVCPMMDAQRQEVYTSLYRWEEGTLQRLWDYRLIKVDKLVRELLALNEKVITLGDGLPLLKRSLDVNNKDTNQNIVFAHQVLSMPRASSIAATGLNEYTLGRTEDYFSIKPFYIRKSNAEEKWEERHGGKS